MASAASPGATPRIRSTPRFTSGSCTRRSTTTNSTVSSAPAASEHWRAALATIAECPNVHVKMSGINMFNPEWTVRHMRQQIRDAIQIFGIERTVYGSNFPLEKLHASYADLIAA